MPVLQLELPDPSATETLGALLADGLAAGDAVSYTHLTLPTKLLV